MPKKKQKYMEIGQAIKRLGMGKVLTRKAWDYQGKIPDRHGIYIYLTEQVRKSESGVAFSNPVIKIVFLLHGAIKTTFVWTPQVHDDFFADDWYEIQEPRGFKEA